MSSSASSSPPVSVADAPAAVEWHCSEKNELKYLIRAGVQGPTTISLRVDAAASSAFIKLRFPASLKALPKTSLYLYIYPERIRSLSCDGKDVPGPVRAAMPTRIKRVRFELSEPGVAIVPDEPLLPKNRASGNTLELLSSLSRATTLTVYLPEKALPEDLLPSLIKAHGNGGLRTMEREADLSTLYCGKGGKIFGSQAPTAQTRDVTPAQTPPSYDELGPSPPRVPEPLRSSKHPTGKRRRLSSGAQSREGDLVEQVCKRVMDLVSRQIGEQLHEMELRMEQRLDKRVDELKAEVHGRLDDVNERLDDLDDNLEMTSEVVDVRIDDQMLAIKEELSEHVREEAKHIEEKVKDELRGTTFSLDFD
ncbi:Centrosome-associated protein cep250 [Neofusicoccum parvum]|uniref:Centrosome-associated protein cep250 n=1 Tax=Neofusicoccum parvum TaxID=310453 RepID=A0ACB5SLU7_9PEZI|nr:Centrosome-associated protein cep250 [Neofusicoccum parvum]